jgi:hypothetical protein
MALNWLEFHSGFDIDDRAYGLDGFGHKTSAIFTIGSENFQRR